MIKKILLSSFILTVIDVLWIKFYMGDKYKVMIKIIQNSEFKFNVIPAILAYLVLCFTINYFCLPFVKENNIKLLTHSFLLGIVVYATYDFTCGAIFEKWDQKLMIIDILWGGVLFSLTNYLTNLIIK